MLFFLASIIFLADQATKYFVRNSLYQNQSLPVINGIFHITLVYNRGAAFGIFKGQVALFIFSGLSAVILILLRLKNKESRKLNVYNLSLGLIFSGSAGNLIDRLVFGHVIDFLDFRVWPVFNIADSAITIGAILLSVSLFKPNISNLEGRSNNRKLTTKN